MKRTKNKKYGGACRKCGQLTEKRLPQHKKDLYYKPYFFSYYFYCYGCHTMYMPEEAKVFNPFYNKVDEHAFSDIKEEGEEMDKQLKAMF